MTTTHEERLIQHIDNALKWAKDFDPEYDSIDQNNAALVGYYSGTLKIIAEYCGLDYKTTDFSKLPKRKDDDND